MEQLSRVASEPLTEISQPGSMAPFLCQVLWPDFSVYLCCIYPEFFLAISIVGLRIFHHGSYVPDIYYSFLTLTVYTISYSFTNSNEAPSLVILWLFFKIFRILWYTQICKAFSMFKHCLFRVHVSTPYKRTFYRLSKH